MENGIILFDGVCNFCNSSINFVIRHDKRGLFRFAPLQSATADQLSVQYHFSVTTMESFILVQHGQVYTKSTAALRVVRWLPFPWKLGYVFIIIPPFIRNSIYSWIARNRYRWFGKKAACMIPTAEIRSRFLG
ncbi:putative DCC family thiol-disulfide oxidoreductase YuxK [Chitinophaga niastensis]|uniref:Putative DCC family thiol-disulfide oxidoreductase YuxK n=1 Tax=Chitinophaga niastensis TaxID=536980 RepID=A0A2P8HAU7_CHINA|nr:thiol-disulfide oxidoreductase DCC family protein [Chitinophaga niastensis]PSL43337.1 putative DCC family thiol-disulfide oxidoreductase YuxK [Chitinophaga niastensis]